MSQLLATDPAVCLDHRFDQVDPSEQELTKALRTWMILRRQSRPDATIARQLHKLESRIEVLRAELGRAG